MIAVCIATYNQETFIAQAIESVQTQVCDESIRIYIGDDASTDGTSDLCKRYAANDKRIVYIRHTENVGLVKNTIELYRQIIADDCEYIAMIDGDDYWIDKNKLQLQIDYLRIHPNVGFVHTAAFDDINGTLTNLAHADKPIGDISKQYGFEGAFHTNCTVMFRSILLKDTDLKDLENQHFRVLDYPLYGIFSQCTQFGFIYQYTSAWRNHKSVSHPTSISSFLQYQYHYIRAWRWLDKRYNGNFHFRWYKAILWYTWQIIYSIIHYCKAQICKKYQ